MYRYSVNLSIAHYSRWNSIADAYMKPVFVITCARIDLFPDETYFTLFIYVTLSPFFIYLLCSSPRIDCIRLLFFIIFANRHWSIPLLSPSTLFNLDLFLSFSYCIRAKKYHEPSLTYFRRNANRTLSERNINKMLSENVCAESCSSLFLLDLL